MAQESTRTAIGQESADASASELDEARWAVISFDKVEGSGMTYAAAAARLGELEAAGIAGLCVVSDEAAARMTRD